MNTRIGLSLALLASASAAALAQESLLGVSAGVFMPQDSELRDMLGKSWFQYGFSPSIKVRNKDLDIRPDLSILSQSKDGNKLTIVSLPFSLTKRFADDEAKSVPYASFGVGPAYFDYSLTRPSSLERISEKRIGWTAHGEFGLVLSNRMRVHARYVKFSEHDSLRFDGVQLGLSYQFFSL